MYLHVSVGIVSVSACICWGYVDACFPRGICDCAGRPGSGSPPALLQPPERRRPGPDTRSEPGSGSPLFYINTWAGVLQPPVLHQHVRGPAAPCSTSTRGPWSGPLTTSRWRGRSFEKNKIFWSCELEMCAAQTLPAPRTAWQSHRQSQCQWRPSSVSPGRYSGSYMQIQANAMTYMQIQE